MAWSDRCPGPSSITFFHFVTYSAVQSSPGSKLAAVKVVNLLLNLIDSALLILSLKLTSCASCVAGRGAKSEDACDVSELAALHWFEGKPSESAIVLCFSIASDAYEAIRSRVLLPKWANRAFVHIEVTVIGVPAEVSLELITRHPRRAAP